MTRLPVRWLRPLWVRRDAAFLGGAGLGLLAVTWEIAARGHWINAVILSSPSKIGEAFGRQLTSGELLAALGTSLAEFAIGFGLAVGVGLAVGLAMGLSEAVEYALDPFIWFLSAAPLVAFYPLIIVWLGFGFRTVVAITFALTLIPVAVNTLAGIHAVHPSLVRTVRAFGGRRIDVIRKVVLPASLPLVLAGLRIGVGRGIVGVVLGEMFSANAGLGYLMTYYGARLRTADLFVPIIVLMIFGVAATQAIRLLEQRVAGWRGG